MLGCGYALLKGAHVRTDMLWEKYSERRFGRPLGPNRKNEA